MKSSANNFLRAAWTELADWSECLFMNADPSTLSALPSEAIA